MFSRALVSIAAFFFLAFALLANAEPIHLEKRQDLGSIVDGATSVAGSIFSQATQGAVSVAGDVTSVGAVIATKVTSIGGHAATIITSAGGQAITLATDGFGVATSFAGAEYTIATAAAANATNTSNAGLHSFVISKALLTGLLGTLGAIFVGAFFVL
ncbi:hypothetical protein C8Q75DRAFT_807847 [Abortiporus biennis]|nr:hypothetical protein C8Q75DRAFT_807847 [Abortiporus biennis]